MGRERPNEYNFKIRSWMRFNKDDFKNVCPNGNEGLDWEQIGQLLRYFKEPVGPISDSL